MSTHHSAILGDIPRLMRASLEGAITTGIVPEPRGQIAPTTSPTPDDEPTSGGSLLVRAWRFVAGPVARQKAAEGSPS
jgi:hypothetical protein